MDFKTDNEIDIQIINTFSQEIVNSLTPENLEYFGINISSDPETDFVYKIYYEAAPSVKIYSKENKNSIVEYLYNLNTVKYLQVVYDNFHCDFSKFDIGLKNRTNENMHNMFLFFEQNIPLFKKYKNEIINLSKMKLFDDDNLTFSSLHFIGFVYENNENTLFKAYWSNYISANEELYNKDYYIKYLREISNIPQFVKLSGIADNMLEYCGGRLYMEGIDYTQEGSVSHKIYIKDPDLKNDVYAGLITSIPDGNTILKERIKRISIWNKLHPEIKCAGFAVGTDNFDNLNLKLYYSIKDNETAADSSNQIKENKLKKTITRYYPIKQNAYTRKKHITKSR